MGSLVKTEWFQLRLDKDTVALLDSQAAAGGYFFKNNKSKVNRSKYIRALIHSENRPVFDQTSFDILKKEYANLARIGGNLNQINYYLGLRIAASEEGLYDAADRKYDDIVQTVSEVRDVLNQVMKLQATIASEIEVL